MHMHASTPKHGQRRNTLGVLHFHSRPQSLETGSLTDPEAKLVPASASNPASASHSAGLTGVQGHAWLGIQTQDLILTQSYCSYTTSYLLGIGSFKFSVPSSLTGLEQL